VPDYFLVYEVPGWYNWCINILRKTIMAKKAAKANTKGERTFEGSSKSGKLQKALNGALKELNKALSEGKVADASATWKLASVSGNVGGIAGVNRLTVTIKATRQPGW
jgi:hypothetical protein